MRFGIPPGPRGIQTHDGYAQALRLCRRWVPLGRHRSTLTRLDPYRRLAGLLSAWPPREITGDAKKPHVDSPVKTVSTPV